MPELFGSKLNGAKSFRKFVSKTSVKLSWLSRKFSVHINDSTGYESAPASLVQNFASPKLLDGNESTLH